MASRTHPGRHNVITSHAPSAPVESDKTDEARSDENEHPNSDPAAQADSSEAT